MHLGNGKVKLNIEIILNSGKRDSYLIVSLSSHIIVNALRHN